MTPPSPEVAEIARKLTKAQADCILVLTPEWQQRGYSKTEADLLWAMDASLIRAGWGPLVDCRLHDEPGQGRFYQHRLIDRWPAVKSHLEGKSNNG